MNNIKRGTEVRKVIPDIVGKVITGRLNAELDKEFLVEFEDAEGVSQRVWFKESELQVELQVEPDSAEST